LLSPDRDHDFIMSDESESTPGDAGGMDFNLWLARIGRDRSTGGRWIELGMVKVENCQGRNFITTAEIARFWRRMLAGEFAKMPAGICAKPGPKPKRPH
jgi:hypothetical protein